MTETRFQTALAKPPKSKLRKLLAFGSLTVHVIAGGTLIALSFWEIQELKRPHRGVAMASPLAIAAPSGGGGAQEAEEPPRVQETEKKPPKETANAQPNKRKASSASAAKSAGKNSDATGTGSGVGPGDGPGDGPGAPGLGGGIVELCVDPDLCSEPPLPTIEHEEPITIPEADLSSLRRLAGDAQIQPPSSTKNAMSRAGERRAVAIMLMCLDKRGSVSRQKLVRSSGYPEYDAKLKSGMRKWRYAPYRANGKATAICTQLTFVYQQE